MHASIVSESSPSPACFTSEQPEEWLHFVRPTQDPLNRQISTRTALPQCGSRLEAHPVPQSPSLRMASTLRRTLRNLCCSAGRKKTRTRCPSRPQRKRIGWKQSMIVQSARGRPTSRRGEGLDHSYPGA